MTRAELVEQIAEKLQMTKSSVERVVEQIIQHIYGSLKKGDRVILRGLGAFSARQKKPRAARNPKTGEKLSVPAKKAPHFKPGKEFKAVLNEEPENVTVAPETK